MKRERFHTVADEHGAYSIDGLPLSLSADYVLAAHLDGFSDGYAGPLDEGVDRFAIALADETVLELEVGYEDGQPRQRYRFSLEYQVDPADPSTRLELGEIVPDAFGVNVFRGVEPGLYRVRWGLEDAYDPIPPIAEDAIVEPGRAVGLRLVVEGRELRGTARLGGQLVKDGWILLTTDPGVEASTRAGRIVDGEFLMVEPPEGPFAFGAVIPRGTPQAIQNVLRGEALPVRVAGWAMAQRRGELHFDYDARSLTLRIAEEFLARYPEAYLTFTGYEWAGRAWSAFRREEAITGPLIRFQLLQPGTFSFTVRRATGGLLVQRSVQLVEADQTITVGAR